MSTNPKNPEPSFKTMFYKDVEFFVHRDTTQKPAKLRLYDALSGLFVASELSKAEAVQLGLPNAVRGKNEEELLQILENRVKAVTKNGESFNNLLSRSRGNNPPGENQQAILKAYREARVESTNTPVASVTTTVAVAGNQPRKEVIKMPLIQQKSRCNLILHCGAQAVPRVEVARVSTPRPTETWQPIPHVTLIETVEDALRSAGLKIGNQVHSLTPDGNRYFGLTELLQGPNEADDFAFVVGLRNSHDKSFPVGLLAGSNCTICDNLAFFAEVKLTRRHTSRLQVDLPIMIASGVGRLMDLRGHQAERVEKYKNSVIRDRTAHDLLVRAFDLKIVPNRLVPAVLSEYRKPRHPQFQDRTVYSLWNAFTEILKGNLQELPRRTQALQGLLDTHVGLAHLN